MERLSIPHIPYTLMWDNGLPYSVCEDFIDETTELIPAWRILQTKKKSNNTSVYTHFKECCEALGIKSVVPFLDRMIVLDYIIANEDRHLNNFEQSEMPKRLNGWEWRRYMTAVLRLIHGLIRDEQGRKMSKSLGNVVDPFDIVDKYGCDAMRYFLTTNSTPGQDLRFSDEKMASSWNYINKIWNISRFVKMNLIANKYQGEDIHENYLTSLDKWILNKMNLLIKDVDNKYDIFEFGEVARAIYNFTWDDFASNYLEMTKVNFANSDSQLKINTCSVLTKVLTTILKLLHPFMPFVTEEIYQNFYNESIMVSKWPQPFDLKLDKGLIENTDKMFEIITAVRTIRNEKNVPMSKPIKISLETSNEDLRTYLLAHREYLKEFINYEELSIAKNIDKLDAIVKVLDDLNIVILLKELINIDEEIVKLKSKQDKLKKEVARSEGMLNNQNFLQKAPNSKIIEEKNKLSSYLEQLKEVNELLLELDK